MADLMRQGGRQFGIIEHIGQPGRHLDLARFPSPRADATPRHDPERQRDSLAQANRQTTPKPLDPTLSLVGSVTATIDAGARRRGQRRLTTAGDGKSNNHRHHGTAHDPDSNACARSVAIVLLGISRLPCRSIPQLLH
jgi:hypothetical protein